MAHLPSFEEILTEVHLRLGLEALPNKSRFTGYGLEVEGHIDRSQQLLREIYEALELDERACRDTSHGIVKMAGILKALELRTWTGNASQQQVLWQLLACVHVPMWARNIAFWSLANIEHHLPPIDAGMPGGTFWFLPTANADTGEIKLPIPKVLEWLLGLLDEPSVEGLREAIGNKSLREKEGGNDAAVRTLRYWLAGNVPKSGDKIQEVFPDDASLSFHGTFVVDATWPLEVQVEKARNFIVDRKRLKLEELADEIPMKVERLVPIFEGSANDEEKEAFVRHVSVRYCAPTMATIRQRLRVARLVQAGYQDLVESLCSNLRPDLENDPRHNKVLQLIAWFETVYNKTIQAWHHGDTNEQQDAWFEAQFPPLLHHDLVLAILPSLDWEARVNLLAERLTRHFLSLDPEQGLQDILAASPDDLENVLRPRIERLRLEHEEDGRVEQLRVRVKSASPYRALQGEESYWVLSQFVQCKELTDKVRDLALKRLAEVSRSPSERGSIKLLALGFLLNGEARSWPKDIRSQVQQLLDEAEADQAAWEQWKAPLLRFKAKHALFENRIADAEKDFKNALDACSERAFGGMRGEIARDGFAVAIIRTALNRKNHELYYRNMLHFMEFQDGVPSFEDAATECEEFFWSTLYHPYPELDPLEGAGKANTVAAIEETFGLIEKTDWAGLRVWLTKNTKLLGKGDLKDARRNSVLMLWLKILYEFEDKLPVLRAKTPPELRGEVAKVEQHLKNRREAIRMLLEAWPEQAKTADFKGQTPLIMAANHGDSELVSLLVPLSDINAQDHLGRTPLHAAVAGRSLTCLEAILAMNPDVSMVSVDEHNTAAHTVVRFGWLEGLQLILDEFPGLAGTKNGQDESPLAMARGLLENYDAWRSFMQNRKSRCVGTKAEFESVVALLEGSNIH